MIYRCYCCVKCSRRSQLLFQFTTLAKPMVNQRKGHRTPTADRSRLGHEREFMQNSVLSENLSSATDCARIWTNITLREGMPLYFYPLGLQHCRDRMCCQNKACDDDFVMLSTQEVSQNLISSEDREEDDGSAQHIYCA